MSPPRDPSPVPPEKRPPRGVPRWLWPPPGATVRRVVICESADAGATPEYDVTEGTEPEPMHLRALQWLLFDYPKGVLPAEGCAFRGEVLLEIAHTEMAEGKVGHAYALNGGPLGDPPADGPRGILWRYVHARVSAVE